MSNITVDKTKCVGCGACVAIAGNNFDFDEGGLSSVINDEVTEATVDAAESCPFSAIKIENQETEKEA